MSSFDALIRQNKRTTVILIVGVSLLLCALAAVIALLIVGIRSGMSETDEAGYVVYQPPPLWQTAAVACGIALLVALLMALFSYYSGAATILSISGARPIEKRDDPQLWNVVEEMCIAANMPLPRIYLINDTAMNAFATGRDPEHACVAITTGLRKRLERDELQGVMAHELSHVRNYDIRLAMVAAVMVGLIVLLADMLGHYLWWGGGGRRRGRDGGGAQVVLIVVALLLAILAPLFARLLQLALSRQREYLADASAAELTRYPEGLARALAKLEADTEVLEVANRATAPLYIVNPFKPHEKRFQSSSLYRTHPDIKERIRRLMGIGRSAEEGTLT